MVDEAMSVEQILDEMRERISKKTEEFRAELLLDTQIHLNIQHKMIRQFSKELIEFEFRTLREFTRLGITELYMDYSHGRIEYKNDDQ